MTHPQYADNLEEKDQNPLWWVFRLGSSNRFRPGKGTLKESRFTAPSTSDSPPPKEQKKDRRAQRRARPRTGDSSRRPLSQQEIQAEKAKLEHVGAGRVYINDQAHVFIIDGNGIHHNVPHRMDNPLRERAFSTLAGLESVQENLRQKAASCLESFRRARMDKTTVTPRKPKPEKPINPLPCTLVLADGMNVDPEDMQPYAQGGAVKIEKPSHRDDILTHYKSALQKVLKTPTTRVLVVISGRNLMNEIKASLENSPKIKERVSFALVKKDIGPKDLKIILDRRHRALTNLINSDRLHLTFRNPFRDNPEASAKRKTPPREKPHSDTNGYNRAAVHARHGGIAPGTV